MRIAAVSTLGLLLATGAAWAQSSYDDRSRDDDRSSVYSGQSYDSGRSRGWNSDDSPTTSQPGRGASFYLKSGDKEFRVDCGDDDSTRECVDAAMMMFRQVQDAQSRTSTSISPSTTGTTISPSTSTSSGASGTTGGSATGR